MARQAVVIVVRVLLNCLFNDCSFGYKLVLSVAAACARRTGLHVRRLSITRRCQQLLGFGHCYSLFLGKIFNRQLGVSQKIHFVKIGGLMNRHWRDKRHIASVYNRCRSV